MKRTYFFFLFILTFSLTYSQSGWQILPIELVQNQSICDIQFLDQNTGYVAIGRNFSPGSAWKSTNGGSSWELIFLTSGYMKALHFTDANTGMLVGFKRNLRRTYNGGENWITLTIGHGARSINGVYFTSHSTGWIVGDSNFVMRTTDYGAVWTPMWSGSTDVSWSDVYFFDASTGIIVGGSSTRSRIIKTTDAGKTWEETFYPQGNWRRLSFSGNIGYAAGTGLLSGLIKTTNRGDTWEFISNIPILNDVYCVNELVVYVVGNSGGIYKTTNGGSSWISKPADITSSLYGVYFLNTNTGWACGDNGKIIKTTTGGDPIGIKPISSQVPNEFSMSQNYPNPFNPETKIRFDIPAPSPLERAGVRLVIYDALGREVAVLVNEELSPGTYEVDFYASNLPSGTYFYRLQAGEYTETKKMVLMK